MPKYIDRDALLEKWQSALRKEPEKKNMLAYGVFKLFIEKLKSEPTADVVEVVRCKDCKSWNKAENSCGTSDADNSMWFETDFCSYGERKDDEE